MDSVVPTPEELKRQEKLMRRIRVADDDEIHEKEPPTPLQQKKIDKALREIINETMDDGSPVKY
ncbi:MAG: hypothetical protein KBI41_03695 [Kiritimatiellae bacterium]|jgi:hypothetical protein|nr:hypothetical protein [Kiritimatiellia bacterium]MDD2349327.1 hypothetical protein [Kiritimatiellia bacterium]MDD3584293.1 hypothetical protein [Kiritimatiellia bacterium]HHU14101.1 hypothetical protein [Lentisphaerota bacterium]HON47211.1 hypothetical protein [Kiritimatiellia bacterium]